MSFAVISQIKFNISSYSPTNSANNNHINMQAKSAGNSPSLVELAYSDSTDYFVVKAIWFTRENLKASKLKILFFITLLATSVKTKIKEIGL